MAHHLIVGAGTIGARVARQLIEQGDEVTCVSRGGRSLDGVRSVAMDGADGPALASLAAGAATIFNCANPAYHRWPQDWPPLANAILSAAQSTGATLVTLSNLYGYGRVHEPMTPQTPLTAHYLKARVRVAMWNDALLAHQAGRVRACEVRASDFIGPGSQGVFGSRVVPRLLTGKSVRVLGSVDQPHSWTYVEDVATTLVACARRDDAAGRVWHVASNPPRTQTEVVNDLCDAARVPRVRVRPLATPVLRVAGVFNPIIRELPHTMYQFTSSFVIDDASTRAQLGLTPTPWATVLEDTLHEFAIAASSST